MLMRSDKLFWQSFKLHKKWLNLYLKQQILRLVVVVAFDENVGERMRRLVVLNRLRYRSVILIQCDLKCSRNTPEHTRLEQPAR
jgi:hypothetical protein